MAIFITILSITGNDITNILNKKPNGKDVVELLAKRGHQYKVIATALGVGITFAEWLRDDDNVSRLIKVIIKWMSTSCSPVTWRTIINVV